MRLLFDENLSPKLPRLLVTTFPDSAHVREFGPLGRSDEEVWAYAREPGSALISKDSDFQPRSLLYGSPPKLVWLPLGNCTTAQLARLVTVHAADLHALDANPAETMLVLS